MTRQQQVWKAALQCLPVSSNDPEDVVLASLASWTKDMGEAYVSGSLLGVFQDSHFVAKLPGLQEEMGADPDKVRNELRREVGQLIHRAAKGA